MDSMVDIAAAQVRRRVILDLEFPLAIREDEGRFPELERELVRLNRATGIEDCLECGHDYPRAYKRTGGGHCPDCVAKYGRG
jgi:hypothetical protein